MYFNRWFTLFLFLILASCTSVTPELKLSSTIGDNSDPIKIYGKGSLDNSKFSTSQDMTIKLYGKGVVFYSLTKNQYCDADVNWKLLNEDGSIELKQYLDENDENKIVKYYVRFRDLSGAETECYESNEVFYDTTLPGVTNVSNSYSNNQFNLSFDCTESSTIDFYVKIKNTESSVLKFDTANCSLTSPNVSQTIEVNKIKTINDKLNYSVSNFSNLNGVALDFYIKVTDESGRFTTITSNEWKLDNVDFVSPVVSITSPITGKKYKAGDSQVVSGSCEAGLKVSLFKNSDGTAFASDISCTGSGASGTFSTTLALEDGEYSLVAKQTDLAENTGSSSAVSIIVDKTAPTLNLLTLPNGGYYNSSHTSYNITGGCSEVDQEIKLYKSSDLSTAIGSAKCSGSSWSLGINLSGSTFVQGDYNFVLKSNDLAGNFSSEKNFLITKDTVVPTGTISLENAALYTKDRSVDVAYPGLSADISEYGIAENNDCTNLSWSTLKPTIFNLTGVGDGVKSISMKFKDTAGNVSSCVTDSIILDTTAPIITFPATPSSYTISSTNQTISVSGGSCSDNLSIVSDKKVTAVFTKGGEVITKDIINACVGTGTGSISITNLDPSLNDGTWSMKLKVQDAAGNIGETSPPVNVVVDKTLPSIMNLNIPNSGIIYSGNVGTYEVSGQCSESGKVQIRVGSTTATETEVNCNSTATWSYSVPTSLAEGSNTLYLKAIDDVGNGSAFQTVLLNKDTGAVIGTVKIGNDSGITNVLSTTLIVNSADASIFGYSKIGCSDVIINISISQNNVDQSVNVTISENAETKFFVKFKDSSNNISQCYEKSIRHDSIFPNISITSPITGKKYKAGDSQVVSGSCEVGLPVSLVKESDGTELKSGISCTVGGASGTFSTTLNLADGEYNLVAKQTDLAGNTGSSSAVSIIVDKTAPTLSLLTLLNGGYYNSSHTSYNITGGCSEVDQEIKLYKSSDLSTAIGSAKCLGSSWSLGINLSGSTYVQGDYNFVLKSNDLAGNFSSDIAFKITKDTVVPTGVISLDNAAEYTKDRSVDVAYSGLSADISEYGIAENNDCTTLSWSTLKPTIFNLTGVGDGVKSISMKFKDTAGNVSSCVTDSIILDTTAPIITFPATPSSYTISSTNKTISVSGGSCSDNLSIVSDKKVTAVFTKGVEVITKDITNACVGTGTGSISITNLDPSLNDGTWSMKLKVQDAAGNIGETSTPVNVVVDKTLPSITNLNIPNSGTIFSGNVGSYAVSGQCSESGKVQIRVGSTTATETEVNCNSTATWSYSVPTSLAEGSSTLYLIAIDDVGNGSAFQTVLLNKDIQNPNLNITNPTSGATISSSSITFNGTCEVITGKQIVLNSTTNIDCTPVQAGSVSGSFSYTVSGLANGSYNYSFNLQDIAGNSTVLSIAVNINMPIATVPTGCFSGVGITAGAACGAPDILYVGVLNKNGQLFSGGGEEIYWTTSVSKEYSKKWDANLPSTSLFSNRVNIVELYDITSGNPIDKLNGQENSSILLDSSKRPMTSYINKYTPSFDAAIYCSTLSVGGYSDWFLPNIEELKLMSGYKTELSISNSHYWSSSESDSSNSLGFRFDSNTTALFSKDYLKLVRCMRKVDRTPDSITIASTVAAVQSDVTSQTFNINGLDSNTTIKGTWSSNASNLKVLYQRNGGAILEATPNVTEFKNGDQLQISLRTGSSSIVYSVKLKFGSSDYIYWDVHTQAGQNCSSPGDTCSGETYNTYYIGKSNRTSLNEGGTVRYMATPSGCGTLGICNNQNDFLTMAWGPLEDNSSITNVVSNTNNFFTNFDFNYGSVNTATVGAGYFAANFCNNLSIGGYDDWYLPNNMELALMIKNNSGSTNKFKLNSATNTNYWSSTEFDTNNVWIQNSYTEAQSTTGAKGTATYLRCVRRF